MVRAIHIAIAGGLLAGCSIPAFDPCPCAAGTTCQVELNRCIRLPEKPAEINGCVIHINGRFYCRNDGGAPGAPLHASPSESSPVTDHLRTSYSFFLCWGTGEAQSRGNLWYYTQGDSLKTCGWLSGDKVYPPPAFEVDPAAFGFVTCTQPPPCPAP
jgi:hypothetical protein